MSKYGRCFNGKVLDYKFKQHPHGYSFWLYNSPTEEYLVGTIYRGSRGEWSAISCLRKNVPEGYTLVNGFASRMGAAEFLLQINDAELREITK
jgi:hypothetical protein